MEKIEDMEKVEEIYEMTAQILVLGYSPEDASERVEGQVVINEVLKEPVVSDWSHLGNPQPTIDRITRQINQRER